MADKFDMTMPNLSPQCRRIQDMLSDYIDGIPEENTRNEIESHLKSCSICMQEYKSMRAVTDLLHAMPKPAIPKELDERLKRTIHEQAVVMAAAPVVDREAAFRIAGAITPQAETAPQEQKEASRTIPVYAPKSAAAEASDDDFISLPIYEKEAGKRRRAERKEIERKRNGAFRWKRLASVAAVFVIGIFTIVLYNNSSDIFNAADTGAMPEQETVKIKTSSVSTSDAGILDDIDKGLDASKFASKLDEKNADEDEQAEREAQTAGTDELKTYSENDKTKIKPSREETMKAAADSSETEAASAAQSADGDSSYSKDYYLSNLSSSLHGTEYSIVSTHQNSEGAWIFEVSVCTGADAEGEKSWNTRVYTGWDGALTWKNK
ncbi:MAG: zf-HC2 domain-containing protein [Clostridia bacterium]|nr:zf-HC2 domain-containing protein [Clostridia bacterium]